MASFIISFFLGASVGSFLTLVADRFGKETIWQGRSHCNHCQRTLQGWELIPLVGYLLVGGHCRTCKKTIPIRYPLFEALTGLVAAGMWTTITFPLDFRLVAFDYVLVALLLVLAFYDWVHQEFPVSLLSSALGIALLSTVYVSLSHGSLEMLRVADPYFQWLGSPESVLVSSGVGLIVGVVALGLLAFPSRGRWMGYGDVWLIGILGLWLGYPGIWMALLVAFYLGALIGLWLLITGKDIRRQRIAFGPFLITGAILVYIWGPSLFMFIMKLWGAV